MVEKFDSKMCPLVARSEPWTGAGRPPCRVIEIGALRIGAGQPVIIGGPCAVESREHILSVARAVKQAGGAMLRGGAYKPRTSPYTFQGLGPEGLEYLAEAKAETGLPVVTEVMDPRLIEQVSAVADVLQVGSRSMQNFPLLVELGRQPRPVLLKRGFSATLEEWLCAAEYIALGGNDAIILCERGIRTFASGEYARNTVDINVIPPLLQATRLPVFLDPSHATGHADLVSPVAQAALAAGVHGLIIEVRAAVTRPEELRSDGIQALDPVRFERLVRLAGRLAALVGEDG
jgi:3-deoxy-7-phosphoheptulonate synthase